MARLIRLLAGVPPSSPSAAAGIRVVGASSDHLVVEADQPLAVGEELRFGLDYSALLRAMTSPFLERVCLGGDNLENDNLEDDKHEDANLLSNNLQGNKLQDDRPGDDARRRPSSQVQAQALRTADRFSPAGSRG